MRMPRVKKTLDDYFKSSKIELGQHLNGMCVCLFVCMYVRTYVRVCMYVCACCLYMYTSVWLFVYQSVYFFCVRLFMCVDTCIDYSYIMIITKISPLINGNNI